MEAETGKWCAYDYEIIEIEDNNKPVKIIVAKDTSYERVYNPLTLGSNVEYEGYGKTPYQPKESDIGNYPPHIELARLDINNENEILKFTSNFGVLGLEGRYHDCNYDNKTYKRVKNLFRPNRKYLYKGLRHRFEFLADFKYAVERYQKAFAILRTIQEKKTKDIDLFSEFSEISQPYLDVIYPLTDMDTIGLPKIIWFFPGLINSCYFRLIQEAQGNRLALCSFKKCRRPFLAKTIDDNYCSVECRHKGTMANLSIRKVKNEIRDMENKEEISKELRWAAGRKAQELYDDGLRDYETLLVETKSFINEKIKGGKR